MYPNYLKKKRYRGGGLDGRDCPQKPPFPSPAAQNKKNLVFSVTEDELHYFLFSFVFKIENIFALFFIWGFFFSSW